MAINFEELKTAFYNWAVDNLPANTPVIFSYENAPRPTENYVTLYISSVVQIGDDWFDRATDDDGTIEHVGDREITLQIGTYGGDCLTRIEDLRTSLQKQTVLDSLSADGIAFVQHFPIQDITELVSSRFENRAQMDVLFRVAQVYGDITGTIQEVEITESFSNGESIVYTDTFTVSIA